MLFRSINKLEDKGYLNRVKDSADDRKVYIEITEQGIKLKEKAKSIPKDLVCKLQLDKEEYLRYSRDFNELIEKLDNIEKYIK